MIAIVATESAQLNKDVDVDCIRVRCNGLWVTRPERPKGPKDEVKQARRAKRVAEGHQLEIGAQRAPRFLVQYILSQNLC